MTFRLEPGAYSAMFPVPASVVDSGLRLAGKVQLQALLYFLRHCASAEVTCEDVSRALNISPTQAEDALLYWQQQGVLYCDDAPAAAITPTAPKASAAERKALAAGMAPLPHKETPTAGEKAAEPGGKEGMDEKKEATPAKAQPSVPMSKPSHEQVAARIEESEQLRELFNEAQRSLGKTIGYDGQSVLIMLHDSYGLNFEVILMLIEYAVTVKKPSFSYIAKIGMLWSDREIFTVEDAERFITEQTGLLGLWSEFRALSGVRNERPTENQKRYFTRWSVEYGFNAAMIHLAYEVCVDNTGKMSLQYMEKVLKGWHDRSISTPADVKKAEQEFKKGKKSAPGAAQGTAGQQQPAQKASYDLDAFAKSGVGIKYKRNSREK